MRQIPHTSDKGRVVIFVIDIVLEVVPGAQPYFSKISFNSRWLEDGKNMEVVLKAVVNKDCFRLIRLSVLIAILHERPFGHPQTQLYLHADGQP